MWWCLAIAKWGKVCPAVCRPFLPPTWTTLSVEVLRLTSPFQYMHTYYISGTSSIFVSYGLWFKLIDPKHFVGYCFLLMRWPRNRPEVVVLALLDDRSETGCFCTEEVLRSQKHVLFGGWEVFLSRGDVRKYAKLAHGGGEFWGLFQDMCQTLDLLVILYGLHHGKSPWVTPPFGRIFSDFFYIFMQTHEILEGQY